MKAASKILAGSLAGAVALLPFPASHAATSKEARVTQIIREVNLLPSDADPRAAALNDKVSEDTGVRTGGDSRSELTFPDLTITRLGANTIFSFTKSGRTAQVDSGSILFRVPKNSGGGSIRSSAVTVAITGTTVIFERGRDGQSRLITLEGIAKVALVSKPDEWRTVRAGQELDVPDGADELPMPTNIDLDQVMRTHPLIVDFKPLPSEPLIRNVIRRAPPPSTGPVRPVIPPQPPSTTGNPPPPDPFPTRSPVTNPRPPKPTPTPTPTPSTTPRLTPPKPTPTPTPRDGYPPKPTPTPTPQTRPPKPTPTPQPTPKPTRPPGTNPSPTPPPKSSPKPTRPPVTGPKGTIPPKSLPSPTAGPILRTIPVQTTKPQSSRPPVRVIKKPTPPPGPR